MPSWQEEMGRVTGHACGTWKARVNVDRYICECPEPFGIDGVDLADLRRRQAERDARG